MTLVNTYYKSKYVQFEEKSVIFLLSIKTLIYYIDTVMIEYFIMTKLGTATSTTKQGRI